MCYAYGNIRTANIQPNPLKDGMPQFMHDVIMEISKAKTFYTCINQHSQTFTNNTILGLCDPSHLRNNIVYCAGVFIDYYGGEAVNNIAQYSARLYFVCKTGTKLDGPHLEHVKDSYTALNTEYVC